MNAVPTISGIDLTLQRSQVRLDYRSLIWSIRVLIALPLQRCKTFEVIGAPKGVPGTDVLAFVMSCQPL
jgi:hypothetical protein